MTKILFKQFKGNRMDRVHRQVKITFPTPVKIDNIDKINKLVELKWSMKGKIH
jgi:hypothetical protein